MNAVEVCGFLLSNLHSPFTSIHFVPYSTCFESFEDAYPNLYEPKLLGLVDLLLLRVRHLSKKFDEHISRRLLICIKNTLEGLVRLYLPLL